MPPLIRNPKDFVAGLVFAAVEKFDGVSMRALTPPEIRQIAGRAGRYGLHDRDPETLDVLSQRLGLTRERVRQIKEKALSRLRHVSRARALESFLG